VIRAIFENYGYTYASSLEQFSHTQRALMGMFGSHSTIGAFTIAGGIGLGVDLNSEYRCYPAGARVGETQSSGCSSLQLAVNSDMIGRANAVPVSSDLYPVILAARISFGVTFD
jgi:hypothetical protein